MERKIKKFYDTAIEVSNKIDEIVESIVQEYRDQKVYSPVQIFGVVLFYREQTMIEVLDELYGDTERFVRKCVIERIRGGNTLLSYFVNQIHKIYFMFTCGERKKAIQTMLDTVDYIEMVM